MNHYPITVVDNFYENPDEIRKFALAQQYEYCHQIKDISYTFPGSRTKDLSIIHPELFQKVCHKLTSLFHNFEHDILRWQITTCFQSVTKGFERGGLFIMMIIYCICCCTLFIKRSSKKLRNNFIQRRQII